MSVRGRSAVSASSLLPIATEVLVADPSASLSDVARAAGMSRTTLHALYPTRHALLVALAEDALELVESAYRRAELDVPGDELPAALSRLVTAMVPLGPRVEFLLRERSLDMEPGLTARLDALDAALLVLVGRAREAGLVAGHVPERWVVAALNALVYAAWEQISLGDLAPNAAPSLVVDTILVGVGPRAGGGR